MDDGFSQLGQAWNRIDELEAEIRRLRAALDTVCNVGDRAAVVVARNALKSE